jgi:hypothetical protein
LNTNPRSPDELNKFIQVMDEELNRNHRNFAKLFKDTAIIGVPIRFALIPIKNYLNINIENIYVKLKESTVEKFTAMLQEIKDFSYINCVRNRVLDTDSESGNIILNKNSEIYLSIRNFEEGLMNITKEYFEKAVKLFKDYKIGNATESDLLQIINDFEQKFSIKKVMDKINSYVNQCKNELVGIQFEASKNNIDNYRLFTDASAINWWFSVFSKPKVLLKTDAKRSKECNLFYLNKINIIKVS